MERERRFEERLKLYPKDAKYLKELAGNLKIPPKNLNKLFSIMGEQELLYYLKQAEYDNFLGRSPFRVNLHTHTSASDGTVDPKDYLDAVLQYMQNNNILKMIVAITDHDTLDAIPIILKKLIKTPEDTMTFGLCWGANSARRTRITMLPVRLILKFYITASIRSTRRCKTCCKR